MCVQPLSFLILLTGNLIELWSLTGTWSKLCDMMNWGEGICNNPSTFPQTICLSILSTPNWARITPESMSTAKDQFEYYRLAKVGWYRTGLNTCWTACQLNLYSSFFDHWNSFIHALIHSFIFHIHFRTVHGHPWQAASTSQGTLNLYVTVFFFSMGKQCQQAPLFFSISCQFHMKDLSGRKW